MPPMGRDPVPATAMASREVHPIAGTATKFSVGGLIWNEHQQGLTRRDMAHEKLLRLLNFLWVLLVFPAVVALLAGFLGHSVSLGIKTFLLVEFGVAILSPLLTAIIWGRDTSQSHRGK